ncbi:MAG TPA: N-methyl-L-tryptophan oxidase [Chloroflexota bacterium]|nr:N-methyl-L-tryptophan oxidase [Chloroflexota bacterium]
MGATYDAIVVGVGGMGSAAAYHLARRGHRVLGLERFDIPHPMGSSHGVSRIIRLAYFEHPSYVPLLRRAYELWRDLERGAGEQLLYITGGIDAGPPDSRSVEGSLLSCQTHGIPHEVLTGDQVNQRFPAYHLPASFRAVYQPDGGFVASERAIVAHVEAARSLGAEIHTRERVLAWEPRGEGVLVETDQGRYEAARLVICAGVWAGSLVPELAGKVVAERQVVAWLQPSEPALFQPDRFPIFVLEVNPEERIYGFPSFSVPGFKLGLFHHLYEQTTGDTVDRVCHPRDEAALRRMAETYFPKGAGATLSMSACMFENSPDEHFIIDTLKRAPQVAVAAGFSGHGYKFCGVVGEIMADLAIDGRTPHDISLFGLDRFLQPI